MFQDFLQILTRKIGVSVCIPNVFNVADISKYFTSQSVKKILQSMVTKSIFFSRCFIFCKSSWIVGTKEECLIILMRCWSVPLLDTDTTICLHIAKVLCPCFWICLKADDILVPSMYYCIIRLLSNLIISWDICF